MKLLSLSYTNIGPFHNQTVKINPRQGSYIIKAPIGSGKSILFFDGPLFALYKKNERPLLNMKSAKGEVVIEFEHEQMRYCIQRILTKTKTGESIKSKMRYQPFQQKDNNDKPIIEKGDTTPFELPAGYEALEFKNEGDLQKIIDDLLPNKEVLLGTYFLMQESKNIFELKPQERLMILKSVFDLLGIDESKEKVGEEKREISALIKARSDTSQYDNKLTNGLTALITLWGKVEQILHDHQYEHLTTERTPFIQEQKLLIDKVLMEHFTLPAIFSTQELDNHLIALQEKYHTTKTTADVLQQNLTKEQQNLHLLIQKKDLLTRTIVQIEQSLSGIAVVSFDDVQHKIVTLESTQSQLWTEQENKDYSSLFHTTKFHTPEAQQILTWSDELSLSSCHQIVQQLITIGKEYKYRLQNFIDKKNLLEEQGKTLATQIQQAERSFQDFQTIASEQSQFFCDKIEGSCPYVELINTGIAKKNKEQLATLQHHYETLQIQDNQRKEQIKKLDENEEKKSLEADVRILGELFKKLNWKQLDEKIGEWNEGEKKIKILQQELSGIQSQQQELMKKKEQLLVSQTEQLTIEQQMTSSQEKIASYQTEQQGYQTTLSQMIIPGQLEQERISLQQFVQKAQELQTMVSEYKNNLLLIKQLKAKEKMLGELYTIFSKELLLLVIQSNLPKIQDLMNAYLAQAVDYQLSMDIDKKSATTDTLELFVKIFDQHGERQVESLSGGQKVILKLVWMIAISFVTNAPMLFLDETINNLDGDTVAKVADMITNFIKTKGPDFQFYVITHSQQIQEMGIWDGVIDIN